nr:hypothetical protein [Clostridia bacterium]
MKKIIVSVLLSISLLICLGSIGVSAADYLKAPGGSVTSAEEFIKALGGDDAAVSKDNTVTLLSDITLTSPIEIKSGKFTLNGAGCHIDRGFDGRAMFIINEKAALTIGNDRGSDDHPSQTFNGNGKNGSFAFISGGELNINVGTLISCFKSDSGAIFLDGGTLNTEGGIIKECVSTVNGAAICVASGTAELYNTTMTYNTAEALGGAIYNSDGNVTIAGCPMSYNKAANGGAVASESGEFTIGSVTFEYNIATQNGGTIYNAGDSQMYIVESFVVYSEADKGGAAYNSGTMVLGSGQFTMNKSKTAGGIYNEGDLQMLELTVTDNEASAMCGGVYNSGTFVMNGGSVSSNKTFGRCGGLLNLGTFYMNEGGISSNKFKDETHKYGQGIENWGKMTLAEHAFISFNNDVLVGAYPNADGTVYRAEVIIESILTANTPIATFTPVYSETGWESGIFTTDFEEGRTILTGEADILTAAAEKLAMSNDGKRTWKLGLSGEMLKDGYVNGNPYIVAAILIAAAAVCGAVTAVIIVVRKKKKSPQNAET